MRFNTSRASHDRHLLTQRETEIVALVASGRTDAEIALDIGLGRRTVSNHVSNILLKLDARTRTEAAIRAIVLGIVDLPQRPES